LSARCSVFSGLVRNITVRSRRVTTVYKASIPVAVIAITGMLFRLLSKIGMRDATILEQCNADRRFGG